jgi:hypothetical protein
MLVAPETQFELQTRVESQNFNLRLLQFFDFFNLRLHISSTSDAMAEIIGFVNPCSRWE